MMGPIAGEANTIRWRYFKEYVSSAVPRRINSASRDRGVLECGMRAVYIHQHFVRQLAWYDALEKRRRSGFQRRIEINVFQRDHRLVNELLLGWTRQAGSSLASDWEFPVALACDSMGMGTGM